MGTKRRDSVTVRQAYASARTTHRVTTVNSALMDIMEIHGKYRQLNHKMKPYDSVIIINDNCAQRTKQINVLPFQQ